MIILDTNVLSEAIRPRPALEAQHWIDGRSRTSLFVTTVSQAEMLLGARSLPDGRRRASLQSAIDSIFDIDFRDRVLSFDMSAARSFAEIVVERRRLGRPIGFMDAQIAAIAVSRRAAIATRNVNDFEHCGIQVINPWMT